MEKRFVEKTEYLSFYEINQKLLKRYEVEKIKDHGEEETCIHIFEPEKPEKTAILIHGYFDHTGGFKNVINHFLAKGWRVVSYDLYGHGLSSGNRAAIEDFNKYVQTFEHVLKYCQRQGINPRTVIAHSTGAAICTHYLLQYKASFDRVIFIAPLVRPMNWHYILLASKLVPLFTKKLKRKFRENSSDENYLTFAQKDPLQCQYISISWVLALIKWNKKVEALSASTQEIYIIQGTNDQTVAWKYNLAFLRRKFNHSQVAIIEEGRHQLMNESKTKREIVMKLIDNYVTERFKSF